MTFSLTCLPALLLFSLLTSSFAAISSNPPFLKPTFHANSFSVHKYIRNRRRAYSALTFPGAIPLLFANFISRYQVLSPHTVQITRGLKYNASIALRRRSNGFITLRIISHHDRTFPVPMHGSHFIVRLLRTKRTPSLLLKISFRPSYYYKLSPRLHRSRNIFASALMRTMVENAQLVLGPAKCSTQIATITGVCNNFHRRTSAIANALQLHPWNSRTFHISKQLPNPRTISNIICSAHSKAIAPDKVNFLHIVFGQFIDHDLVLTPSVETVVTTARIPMPQNDLVGGYMAFHRSDPLPFHPRECCSKPYVTRQQKQRQYNKITSFIDASGIYGSTNERAMALRSLKNGKLIMTKKGGQYMLPRNSDKELNYKIENADRHLNPKLFASGDVRANENPFLCAMHTLFAREHNRVCDVLIKVVEQRRIRRQSDEWLYQQARRIVIAELQNIVYHEFLPPILGSNALKPYKGYNSNVDASIDIMFSTAAYRWGHSTLADTVYTTSMKNERKKHELKDLFFEPDKFDAHSIESWLLGAMEQSARAIDVEHADSIRNFLFRKNRKTLLDLVSLNIQRGRDHGLPGYEDARWAYGLGNRGEKLGSIEGGLRAKILRLYGSSKKVDVLIGGLAEKAVRGGLVGPLYSEVIKRQFERLRDGDRFYYENISWGKFMSGIPLVSKIKRHDIRLKDVIQANTAIRDMNMPSATEAMKTV